MSEKTEKEEVVEKEEFSVPIWVMDDEVYNATMDALKKEEEVMTPPEGQKLLGMKSYCSIHGDITGATKVISFNRIYKYKEKMIQIPGREVLCKACFADWIRKQREAGVFGRVKMFPLFGVVEEEDKKENK